MEKRLLHEAVHRWANGTLFLVEVDSRGVLSDDGEDIVLGVVRDSGGRRSGSRESGGPADRA